MDHSFENSLVASKLPAARREAAALSLRHLSNPTDPDETLHALERFRTLLQTPDTLWQGAFGLVDLLKAFCDETIINSVQQLPNSVQVPLIHAIFLLSEATRAHVLQGRLPPLESTTLAHLSKCVSRLIRKLAVEGDIVREILLQALEYSIQKLQSNGTETMDLMSLRRSIQRHPEFEHFLQLQCCAASVTYGEEMNDFLFVIAPLDFHRTSFLLKLVIISLLEPMILRGVSIDSRTQAFCTLLFFDNRVVEEVLVRLCRADPAYGIRPETANTAALCLQILLHTTWTDHPRMDYVLPRKDISVDADIIVYLLMRLDEQEIQLGVLPDMPSGTNAFHYAARMRTYIIPVLDVLSAYLGNKVGQFCVPDADNKTPMHYAAESGSRAGIAWFLHHLGSEWMTTAWDVHPMHVCGSEEVLQVFLDAGLSLDTPTSDGSLLMSTIQAPSVVLALARTHGQDDVNHRNANGETALFTCKGEAKVDMLVDFGAELEMRNADGFPALHIHARQGNVRIVRRLLEKLADITSRSKDGNTVLHGAHERCLPLLLAHLKEFDDGFEHTVNHRNNAGRTPLLDASPAATEILLGEPHVKIEYQCDPQASPKHRPFSILGVSRSSALEEICNIYRANARTMHPDKGKIKHPRNAAYEVLKHAKKMCGETGMTPLLVALHEGDSALAKVDLLLDRKAAVTVDRGVSPLWIAMQTSILLTERLLSDERVLPQVEMRNLEEPGQPMPIHYAAATDDKTLLYLLLKNGASVDAVDGEGRTVAQYAGASADTLKWLRKVGADMTAPSADGQTLLHSCVCAEVFSLALESNCDVNQADAMGVLPLVEQVTRCGATKSRDLATIRACVKAASDIPAAALVSACQFGRLDITRYLISVQAQVNARTSTGERALHAAARVGHPELVQHLLLASAEAEAPTYTGETPLHCAVSSGDIETLTLLFSRNQAKVVDFYGELPRERAARLEYTDIVTLLVSKSTESKRIGDLARRPSMSMSLKSLAREGTTRISDHGLDMWAFAILGRDRQLFSCVTPEKVQQRDAAGRHLVHAAAMGGNANIVFQLLEMEPSLVNCMDSTKRTALHYCARLGNDYLACCDVLLMWQADVHCSDGHALSPLLTAAKHGAPFVVDALMKKNADVSAVDDEGNGALHHAADGPTVMFLLENGLSPDIVNNAGWSPAHVAAFHGRLSVLKVLCCNTNGLLALACAGTFPICVPFLLGASEIKLHKLASRETHPSLSARMIHALFEAKGDPNGVSRGNTPVHGCSNPTILDALISCGGSLTIENSEGMTPPQMFASLGYTELLQHCAPFTEDMKASLLPYACQCACVETIDFLCDGDYKILGRSNALHWCAHDAVQGYILQYAIPPAYESTHDWINRLDENGWTPLLHAIWRGNSPAFVDALVDFGAVSGDYAHLCRRYDIFDILDLSPERVLASAVASNDIDRVLFILDHGVVDTDTRVHISSPEMLQCFPPAVRCLCDVAIDSVWMLKAVIASGPASLLISCAERGLAHCVEYLLSQGFAVNTCDTFLRTPLFAAARNGHYATCKILLAYAADVDARNLTMQTPLLGAITSASPAIIQSLLDARADTLARDDRARGVVHYCCMANRADLVREFRKLEHRRTLDRIHVDIHGDHPLCLAARFGARDVCSLLPHLGASNRASAPLLIATTRNYVDFVRELTSTGLLSKRCCGEAFLTASELGFLPLVKHFLDEFNVSLETRNSMRSTALHLCARRGQAVVCGLLLERMCDIEPRNQAEQTPVAVAFTHSHDVARLITAEMARRKREVCMEAAGIEPQCELLWNPMKRLSQVFGDHSTC